MGYKLHVFKGNFNEMKISIFLQITAIVSKSGTLRAETEVCPPPVWQIEKAVVDRGRKLLSTSSRNFPSYNTYSHCSSKGSLPCPLLLDLPSPRSKHGMESLPLHATAGSLCRVGRCNRFVSMGRFPRVMCF